MKPYQHNYMPVCFRALSPSAMDALKARVLELWMRGLKIAAITPAIGYSYGSTRWLLHSMKDKPKVQPAGGNRLHSAEERQAKIAEVNAWMKEHSCSLQSACYDCGIEPATLRKWIGKLAPKTPRNAPSKRSLAARTRMASTRFPAAVWYDY